MSANVVELTLEAKDNGFKKVFGGASDTIRSLVRDAMAMAGLTAGAAGIGALIKQGIEFNKTMESSRLAIAGMIQTFNTASGAAVPFKSAMAEATVAQKGLRLAALETAATFSELIDVFQTVYPAAVQAGFKTDQIVKFSKTIAQLAAATQQPLVEVSRQISLVLQGSIQADGKIGLLFKGMGVTNEIMESWRAQGVIYEKVMGLLKPMADLAPEVAKTWEAAFSNMKDAASQLLGTGMTSVFDALKDSVLSLGGTFVKIEKGGFIFNPEILARVRSFSDAIAGIIGKLTPLLASTVAFGASFLAAGANAASAFSPVLDILTTVLNITTKVTDGFGSWVVGIWAAVKAFTALEAVARGAVAATVAAQAAGFLPRGGGAAMGAASAWAIPAVAGASSSWAAPGAAAAKTALSGSLIVAAITAFGAAVVFETKRVFSDAAEEIATWGDSRAGLGSGGGARIEAGQQALAVGTLDALALKNAAEGNRALADRVNEVRRAYEAHNITADGVIAALREMSQVGREAFQANAKAADPAVLQQYAVQLSKVQGQIEGLGQTGLTASLTKLRAGVEGEMLALKVAMAKAIAPEERSAIGDVVAAQAKLYQKSVANAYHEAAEEAKKGRLEIAKETSAIAEIWLEGGAREVAAIASKADSVVAALENERRMVTETDSASVGKIKNLTTQIGLALQRRGAEMAEWAKKTWETYRDAETQARQTILEAEGNAVGAQMLALKEKYRKLMEDAKKALVGAMANPQADNAVAQIVSTIRTLGLAESAETEKLTRENRVRLATVRGDWRVMAEDIRDRVTKGLLNARDGMRELGDAMVRFGKTYGEGAMGAVYGILETIPTAAESAAAAVQGVWSSMTRSFDDLFFNVLSGRLDNLKDVFKNLWDSVLQTASRFMSDLLQRWIKTQVQMQATGGSGGDGVPTSGDWASYMGAPGSKSAGIFGKAQGWGNSEAPGGWGNAAGRIGVGLGIGSIVGQFGNGKYNQTGAMIGGAIGSIIPGLGTIIGGLIGAVVGLIIGALASPNTEQHVRATFGNLLAVEEKKKWVYDKNDPEGGRWVTTGGSVNAHTKIMQDTRDVFESQATRMFDMFRVGAKDKAAELFAAYQQTLADSLRNASVDIHAGSEADIQKDMEVYLQKLLPRISLSAAFGQTGYLPTFDHNAPGGIPGVAWNAPEMDLTQRLFDPDAPIPTMLRDLGVTADRIGELASKISTEDPEKLLKYIEGLVGVLVEFQRLGTAMGQTVSEVWAGFDKQAGTSPAAGIASTAQDIADLFDVIDTYSGDTQLEKMKEAEGLSSALWDSVLDYMAKLKTLADQLSAGLQGMRGKMRDFLNPRSEAESNAADWSNVTGVWGRLLQGKTPQEIEEATNSAAASIERMFNVMAERVTRGKALIDRITTLTGGLWDIGKDVAFADLEKSNPIAAMGQDLVDIQRQVGDAARLTGLEQITAMESTAGSAEEMAGKLRSLFAEISSVSASINKSFDSQIWELGVGELDPKGQASAITQRIHDLQEQLKIATSPSEIQAIASEIQSLTSRYVGTFGQDDAKRAEAIAWAQEQLDRARGLAQDTLDLLRSQAEAYAEELRKTMSGSVSTISTNVDEASGIIGQLSHTLGALDTAVQEAIKRLGQDALDALAPLREAMQGGVDLFTGATGEAATALTAPEVGLTASTDRASARMDVLSDAAGRAAANLDRLANAGGGGQSQTQTSTQSSSQASSRASVSASQVVPIVRRYYRALTPRVA